MCLVAIHLVASLVKAELHVVEPRSLFKKQKVNFEKESKTLQVLKGCTYSGTFCIILVMYSSGCTRVSCSIVAGPNWLLTRIPDSVNCFFSSSIPLITEDSLSGRSKCPASSIQMKVKNGLTKLSYLEPNVVSTADDREPEFCASE